jgi:hypothetical protein
MKGIKPLFEPIIVQGKLVYSESSRAYNVIWLKKKIIDLFSDELRKRKKWMYKLEYCWNLESTLRRVTQVVQETQNIPLLLFIYEDTNE